MAVIAPESTGIATTSYEARIGPSCAGTDCPHRTQDENLILFQPHLLSKIPRGWERAPTNAFTARLKGHRVWKRYNLRSLGPTSTGAAPASEISGPEDVPAGTGRAVKRLRVGERLVPALERPGTDGWSYVGTLWGSSAEDKKRKIASRRSARHDELSRVSPLGEAVSKYEGGPQGAQGKFTEEGLSGHLPQLSGKGEHSAGPVSVQASAITLNDKAVDCTTLFNPRARRLSGPKTKLTVQHATKIVKNGRRASIAGRMELLRTPCKGLVSPGYRTHPKSAADKAKRRMSSLVFAQDRVRVACTTETAGDDPATGMSGRKEMQKGSAEEAASLETQIYNTPGTLVPEQDCTSSSGSVTESHGCDISPPLANIPSVTLDASMSEVQASASVTEPCAGARLGSRLSDDTNMLKDFLVRVKAKKAAMGADMSETVRPVSPSAPKSPRRVLAAVETNLPSPRRSQKIANRPGTPPGKHLMEASDLDELNDGAVESTSFRRSARVRLPAPPKLARGTPSLIPVRRRNGPEPVVLPKSVAQELAFITRANTRRNKGRSKPADLTLLALAKEAAPLNAPEKEVREGAKRVAWDETLLYHLEGEAKEEEEMGRPTMRRLKGLGTANGTPAAKKEDASLLPHPLGSLGHRRKGRTKA